MSIRVDWGFKTIPVKIHPLCRRGRGSIRISGIEYDDWYYFNKQWASMMISTNSPGHLDPNILSPYRDTLSQSTTVLSVKGRAPNISPDPSFPIFSRLAECPALGTRMVPISDLGSAHFISDSGPTTCAGQ